MDPLLETLLLQDDLDLLADCASKLRGMGYAVIENQDYVWGIPKGEVIPVCLTAHVDTRRIEGVPIQLVQTGDVIANANGILGADDRAGIYALYTLLDRQQAQGGAMPVVLFTNGEERGGIGARAFIEDGYVAEAPYLKLFIGLDRKGANEFVYYSAYLPDEVRDLVERHGMVEAIGSFSDVMLLTEATEIPHVNVSVGYMREHTPSETLNTTWLQAQIDRVQAMLNDEIPDTRVESQDLYYFCPEEGEYFEEAV
jgi:tripeptide aminopeptidase